MTAQSKNIDELGCMPEKRGMVLLEEKIKKAINEQITLIVTVSNATVECRNTFYLDEYEFDGYYLYLNNNNYELHINCELDMKVEYDDFDDCFVLTQTDTEIRIYMLE